MANMKKQAKDIKPSFEEVNQFLPPLVIITNDGQFYFHSAALVNEFPIFASKEMITEFLNENKFQIQKEISDRRNWGKKKGFSWKGFTFEIMINVVKESNGTYFGIHFFKGNPLVEKVLISNNEQILTEFLKYAPAAIAMFDKNMNYLCVSRRWCKEYPTKYGENLIGLNHYEVHPEVPEKWKRTHALCMKGAIEKKELDLLVRPDGSEDWFRYEVRPWYNDANEIGGIMLLSETITEIVLAKRKLQQTATLQQAILRALPDFTFKLRRDGTIVQHYFSEELFSKLKITEKLLEGANIQDLLPHDIVSLSLLKLKEALETKEVVSYQFKTTFMEEVIHFETRLNAINEEEVIVVIRNISQLANIQEELTLKVKELDEQNKKMERYIESNMELETFAYVASHDLREPLRTIGGFTQLLERKYAAQFDANGLEYLDYIKKSTHTMNQLIVGLLEYSRINTENFESREEIKTTLLLQEVIDDIQQTIFEQQAEVSFGYLPQQITGLHSKIKRLFQNLISNGIKFSSEGQKASIHISGLEKETHWEFKVVDNGIGIQKEYLEKIFLLFKKLQNNTNYQGAGIGLAICKKIVEQHQGEIWVTSEVNQGASFYFTLAKELII